MRRNVVYLVTTLVITLLALTATVLRGDSPVLGLDLQGGISVVLAPAGDATSESLDVAVDIIRSRVDALGVAEPEISRSGDNVVIDLPGVKDRDKARRLVGRTAEVRFRPVLALVPPRGAAEPSTTTTTPTTTATTVRGQHRDDAHDRGPDHDHHTHHRRGRGAGDRDVRSDADQRAHRAGHRDPEHAPLAGQAQ